MIRLRTWKHPRIRGENDRVIAVQDEPQETSPHTRGERQHHPRTSRPAGNIPAYAGRTKTAICLDGCGGKHPRIRGENFWVLVREVEHLETSPHTRGERFIKATPRVSHRNIPAYAGRTLAWFLRNVAYGKHPRIRGENFKHRRVLTMIQETSPHTRGEHSAGSASTSPLRNIPAYAGRTHHH